jgi:catechol-2,3-dioxygenase
MREEESWSVFSSRFQEAPTTRNHERPIKALGEIALRVTDLDTMQRFYENIVGLELMRRTENAVFFKIADGYGGHTQVLALFDRSSTPGYKGPNAATSTVDHIAFQIPLAQYASEKARLESLGLTVTTAEHAWVHWRSLYVVDPEGNEVEWVCYDESVG